MKKTKETDYYECLGLTRKAATTEIKQAYRKLALVVPRSHRFTIPIRTKTRRRPRSSSHRSQRPTLVSNPPSSPQ